MVWPASVMASVEMDAANHYSIAAPDAWVEVQTEIPEPSAESPEGSVEYLLIDRQVRVHAKGASYYTQFATRVLNESGVDEESHLKLDFDPASEKLVLHTLQVKRGKHLIDHFDRMRASILRRESSLEDGILDGSLTLSLLLEDIKVGDIISYSYSRERSNELLGQKFSSFFTSQWTVPVALSKLRLVLPAQRHINLRQHLEQLEPEVKEQRSWRELRWSWKNQPAIVGEGGRPAWHEQYPNIQFSEYGSWKDVIAWALPLYRTKEAQPELAALIEKWRSTSESESERILSAVLFVQDEIRYTGLEMGAGAYRPSDPSVVLRRRFGDCKDKALLLATMLNRMGIRASPALVSTDDQRGVLDLLPSHAAFDHVIVRVEHGGRTYWLDATSTQQGGTLETIQQSNLGAALVIAEGVEALEVLPPRTLSAPSIEIDEVFDLTAGVRGVGRMSVTTTYHGAAADGVRRSRQSDTMDDVGRRYLNFYRKWYPGVRLAAPVSDRDDRRANVFVVKEQYEIEPAFAEDDDDESLFFEINSHTIDDERTVPQLVDRQSPLAINHPVHVVHQAVVKLPEAWNLNTDDTEIVGPGFRYTSNLSYSKQQLHAHYEFKTLADHIAASDVPEYAKKIKSVHDDTYYKFTYGGSIPKVASTGLSIEMLIAVLLGTLGGAGLALAYRHAHRWINPAPADANAPIGLGGWMILPVLGAVLGPLVMAYTLYELGEYARPEAWTVGADSEYQFWLHAGVMVNIGLGITLLIGYILNAVALFTRDRRFPSSYILLTWLGVIWGVCSEITADAIDPANAEIPVTVASIVFNLVASVLWTAYMLTSQRVRATFTRGNPARLQSEVASAAA